MSSRDPYQYPYLEGFLFFVTRVYSVGNVGVAVGWYGTPNFNHYTPLYFNNDYGLVIFFFDDEDNIIEVIFIPFHDLGNEYKMSELAAVAIVVGLIFIPPVGMPVATMLGVLSLGFHCDSRTWDHWRDMLEAFQDLVDEDREQ